MTLDQQNRRIVFVVLRLFLVQFWLLQFFTKLRDQETGLTSLHNLSIWSHNTTAWFLRTSPLPSWALVPYTAVVPYVELALGLLLLVGFQMRVALIVSALYLVSLDVGLMFQAKHDVVAFNTVFLFAMLWALVWEPDGRIFSVDALRLQRARSGSEVRHAAG